MIRCLNGIIFRSLNRGVVWAVYFELVIDLIVFFWISSILLMFLADVQLYRGRQYKFLLKGQHLTLLHHLALLEDSSVKGRVMTSQSHPVPSITDVAITPCSVNY